MKKAGFLYVVEEETGFCRFGFSSDSKYWGGATTGLQTRVCSVVRYSPRKSKLVLTAYHHRVEQFEQALQHIFRHNAANGDWFEIPADRVIQIMPEAVRLEKSRNRIAPKICRWIKQTSLTDREISRQSGLTPYQVGCVRKNELITRHYQFEALSHVMAGDVLADQPQAKAA